MHIASRVLGVLFATAVTSPALAQIEVGPTRAYHQLSEVADSLQPGDLVLVDGDASYDPVAFEVDGEPDAKITIRGVPVNGKLPLIQGQERGVELAGDHYVFEGFEITGASSSCLFHHAHDITVRGVVVHGCTNHGILGADDDSGSLLLEYSEIYGNGEGSQHHQIYMATDENAYPGAVFRMQHCYVHDATGGNSVKSRAERNEIYYNWIEGARYHELELIGPDEDSADPPDPLAFREDSDVVGNVLRKAGTWTDSFVIRVGADMLASEGTNATRGRYRFLHNTVLLAPDSGPVFRLFGLLESIEMHNNVIFRGGGGPITLVRESEEEMAWVSGRQLVGSSNWVSEGSTDVSGWTGTTFGADPLFVDLAAYDIMPAENSPLRGAALESPLPADGYDFPDPLVAPQYLPPARALEVPGEARLRPSDDARDVGASEFGEIPTTPSGGSGGSGGEGGEASSGGSAAGGAPGGGNASGGDASGGSAGSAGSAVAGSGGTPSGPSPAASARDDGGCGCRLASASPARLGVWALVPALFAARRRRRRRSVADGRQQRAV